MTIPGQGGQPPPRPDQQYQGSQGGAVAAGSTNVVRAREVIVSGPTGAVVGVFVYAAGTTPGLGNEPVGSMTNQTSDPFGNPTEPGTTGYAVIASGAAAGTYAMQLGQVTVFGTPAPGLFITNLNPAVAAAIPPSVVALSKSSGCELVLGSGASAGGSTEAAVVVQDSTFSGQPAGVVNIVASQLQVNGVAVTVP